MSDIYLLNGHEVYICDVPAELRDYNAKKYARVFEPSQAPGHPGRHLLVRRSKLKVRKDQALLEKLK